MADEESDVELDGVDMEADEAVEEEEEEDYGAAGAGGAAPAAPALVNASTMGTRGGGGTVVAAAPKKAAPKRDAAFEEARKAQKERLANMKEFGTSMEGVDVGAQREKRLNYLMAQSEVFSHFMEENSDGGFKRAKAKAGRTRMTEAVRAFRLSPPSLPFHHMTRSPFLPFRRRTRT